MSQDVECGLFFYADDPCLVYQYKDINEIQKHLNEDISNIFDWVVNNKLSIHFGEDKTKSIIFTCKFKRKNIKRFKIKYGDIQIKQHSKVKYLECLLDKTMFGEAIVLIAVSKINSKLTFLHRENSFLTPALRRLLCNASIKPDFDYACSAWYPNLTKKIKHRIQNNRNKCMRFCL